MKNYRPASFGWIFLNLICYIMCLCVILINIFFYDDINIVLLILTDILVPYHFVKQIIFFLKVKISLTDEYLYVPNSFENKLWRVQFEEKIFYDDIIDVKIVPSINNSKNTQIKSPTLYGSTYKKYLEFQLIDGAKKRVWINYYTKKQVIKILTHISKYKTLDIQYIMKRWYTTYKQLQIINKETKDQT